MSYSTGALKDKKDKRDYKISGIQAPVELPESYRLNDPFPIKNQDGIPSCTCQSTSYHKQLQESVELSPRYLYQIVKNKIEKNKNWGAYTRNAFKALVEYGICELTLCPEVHTNTDEYLDDKDITNEINKNAEIHKSKTYWRVDATFEGIKQSIYQNKQMVVISVPWYKSFNYVDPSTGIMRLDKNTYTGIGHAMAVVGWKDNYLILKNSFGDRWGLNGMGYYHKNLEVWDAWTSLDLDEEPAVKSRYGQKSNVWMEIITGSIPWLRANLGRWPSQIEVNALWYGKWDAMTVFKGTNGNIWLHKTKAQAIKDGFNYKYVPWK